MDGVLSQEEINALLNNNDAADSSDEILTESEKDAIGEIANISMGTAATTLFSLVNRRVEISTPVVSFSNWDKIVDEYETVCVHQNRIHTGVKWKQYSRTQRKGCKNYNRPYDGWRWNEYKW